MSLYLLSEIKINILSHSLHESLQGLLGLFFLKKLIFVCSLDQGCIELNSKLPGFNGRGSLGEKAERRKQLELRGREPKRKMSIGYQDW